MNNEPRRIRAKAREVVTALTGKIGEEAVIDVTMLGSVGVGKTTLLASMYEQFGQVIGTTDLQVTPVDHPTSVKLQEYIEDLRRIAHGLRVEGGIPGTGEPKEYAFGVGRKGHNPLFTLRFTDYPGKYLLGSQRTDGEMLQRALNRAHVILVAIDVPALMERNGYYHTMINKTQMVTDTIKRMLQRDMARLIILTPLKCEKYVTTAAGRRELKARIDEEYRPLINHIGSGDVRGRTACVVTPVQTVGSVVFHRLEEDPQQRNPVFHFRLKEVDASYAPLDTDQLLRYALSFVVNKYRDNAHRGVLRTMWERAIGTDTVLTRAVDQFGAGRKSDDGFAVLQTHPYLRQG
ncbi:TRAFAC clade GTPase domain-containing protein [Nonomuraea jiangxiensis]|uniref:Double-GTPase 2 domain-containing protein n=1 Tax=Nonomuraea jiangxiensis TaxID=633440 RepID=A0A1G9P6I5_9ACTN|nr:hypothetical protein [Nonomuraea jiangxiensis]SDL94153.1 hypothetical protein SAMN05421869_13344 [Nonomuraea jiangxiensis]